MACEPYTAFSATIAYQVPLPMQFAIYLFIGGASAVANLAAFLLLQNLGIGLSVSLVAAFVLAAAFNYLLCVLLLFQHSTRWNHAGEVALYVAIIVLGLVLDVSVTRACILMGLTPWLAKSSASLAGFGVQFPGEKVSGVFRGEQFEFSAALRWKRRRYATPPEQLLSFFFRD